MVSKTSKIASLLLFATVAISACDQQQAPLPDVGDSLRDFTKVTLKVKISGGLRGNGEWPDGIEVPFPFPDVLRPDLINLTNQGIAAGWGGTEEAHAACYEACGEVGQEWSGRTFAEGDYEFGEAELYEGEDGSVRYGVDIEYDVALGCECGYAPEEG